MILRISAGVFLLVAALSFPWWVWAVSAFMFVLYWSDYYEAAVSATLIDLLFGVSGIFAFSFSIAIAILIFFINDEE